MATDSRPLRVGVLGAGMIATAPTGVLRGIPEITEAVDIVAIASRTRGRAQEVARRFGIPQVLEVEELLHSDDVDAVINLTPIAAHFPLNKAILRSGKHLATEKPLAGTLDEADELIRLAGVADLRVIASPPRLLEPSRVRAARFLDSAAIGKVTFARARASHAGPAALSWPSDPSSAYAADSSPLRDLAPYAIQQLAGLLGPVRAVSALSGRIGPTRLVEGGPFNGGVINVQVNDNTVLLLDFGDSIFGVVDAGFSVRAASSPTVEIFGTEGTLNLYTEYPPRTRGSLEIYTPEHGWRAASPDEDRTEEERQWRLGRALLLEELARAVRMGRDSVLSAASARHTLAVIIAAETAAATGGRVPVAG